MIPNLINGSAHHVDPVRNGHAPDRRDEYAPAPKVEVSVRDLVDLIRREDAAPRESDTRRDDAAAPQDQIALRDLYQTLVRGRWLIIGAVLAVLLPVALLTFLQTPRYKASSYLLVHKEDSGLASILPTDGPSALFPPERNLGNELFVLRRSASLADSAAARLIAFGRVPRTGEALTILEPDDEGRPATADLVADRLQEEYVTSTIESDDVDAIRITVASTVPAEAALIANVYATEFVQRTQESSRAGYNASRTFLEGQVEEESGALASADAAVRSFMTQEGAVALDEESSHLVGQLAELQAQRDAANVEVRMKRATVGEIERELEGIEPALARRIASGADREIASTQERVAQIEGRLEQMYNRNPGLRTASPMPAEVAELQRQAEVLRDRVESLSQQLLTETLAAGGGGPGDQGAGVERATELRRRLVDERIALSGLEAQRDVLGARIAEYEGELRQIPAQQVDLARLQRDRQSTERLYLALQEKLQEARVAEQGELGYAQLVRAADVPTLPVSPRKSRNLLAGSILGLMLGFVLAFVRARMNDQVDRPDVLQEAGYTVIGTITDTTALANEEFGGKSHVDVDGHLVDTHLVALLNPLATASEGYRVLRTNIQFSRPDIVVETILVTSSKPGEGKSTTAANLAVVMAQAGRKTLLVDADLRRPTLHKKLGVMQEPGLVQLLFQDGPFDETTYATIVDDLYVIPAGTRPPNPSELLGSRAMRDLIAKLRDHFDVIIFDAPPVLAATDAVLLSTQCDATVLITQAGETRLGELAHAYEALQSVGARVIGTVMNRFDLTRAYGYGAKYAYRYGSQYAYGHDKAEPVKRRRFFGRKA